MPQRIGILSLNIFSLNQKSWEKVTFPKSIKIFFQYKVWKAFQQFFLKIKIRILSLDNVPKK